MATTVVTNPVGPAGPGSQNPAHPGRSGPRPSWVASHTPVQAKRAVENTSRFFRANPWQSTALVLSVVSLAANIIALFSPWLTWTTGKFNWTGGEQEWYGQATLLDVKVCKTFTEAADVDKFTASKSCTIWLQSNGPTALDWMTHVGGAAFAMLILALVANVLAFWLTYLRRIGALKSLPAFAARLRDWLPTVILHLVAAVFLMIAFAIWAGRVKADANADSYGAMQLYSTIGGSPFALAGSDPSVSYGGGFGLAIVGFIASIAAGVILFFFRTEFVPPPTQSPHGDASGAYGVNEAGATAVAPGPAAFTGTAGGGGGVATAVPLPGSYSAVEMGGRGSLPFPPAGLPMSAHAEEGSGSYRPGAPGISGDGAVEGAGGGYGSDDHMSDVKI